jgi:hypothetical protein
MGAQLTPAQNEIPQPSIGLGEERTMRPRSFTERCSVNPFLGNPPEPSR